MLLTAENICKKKSQNVCIFLNTVKSIKSDFCNCYFSYYVHGVVTEIMMNQQNNNSFSNVPQK